MKMIVETTDSFQMICPHTGTLIPHNRPAVVTQNSFIDQKVGQSDLKVLAGDLPDEADDDEFAGYFKEAGNKKLAVSSYVSKFEPAEDDLDAKLKSMTVKELRDEYAHLDLEATKKTALIDEIKAKL